MVVGEADVGRALVLVFSDGADTASWLTATELLRTAQRSDAVIYSITAEPAARLLQDLGHATGGNVLAGPCPRPGSRRRFVTCSASSGTATS